MVDELNDETEPQNGIFIIRLYVSRIYHFQSNAVVWRPGMNKEQTNTEIVFYKIIAHLQRPSDEREALIACAPHLERRSHIYERHSQAAAYRESTQQNSRRRRRRLRTCRTLTDF